MIFVSLRFFLGALLLLWIPRLWLRRGLTFLPVLLSLLANRPLTVFARRTHHTGARP